VYTGEMDEEDDSPEMKQLKVRRLRVVWLLGGIFS